MFDTLAYHSSLAPDLLAIWHAADPEAYPIMPDLWDANTRDDPSFEPSDLLVATRNGHPVGFALTKRYREAYPGCERFHPVGYLALLAVAPQLQGQGLGTELVRRAEAYLSGRGATKVVVGGSFHHFFPGLPAGDRREATFAGWGYRLGKTVWDVRRDLSEGPELTDPDEGLRGQHARTRALRPADQSELLEFLERTFAGRWPRDVAFHLRHGGRIEEVVGLFVDGALGGFAQLHPAGCGGTLRWAGFDRDIGALGPIGVAPAHQGRGLGQALLVAGLRELQRRGATRTVIDWTDLLDFYGRAGFEPWLRYVLAEKPLA